MAAIVRRSIAFAAALVTALGLSSGVAGAVDAKTTVPILITASRSVAYPSQYSVIYAKVGVQADGGTLTITDELGKIFATGPATSTLRAYVSVCKPTTTVVCAGVGLHTYTAHFSGSAKLYGADSPPVVVQTNLFAGLTRLTSSANPSVVGHAVSFYGYVLNSYTTGGTKYVYAPTGSVSLYEGTIALGKGAIPADVPAHNDAAKITVGGLTVGEHVITAIYSGDANYAAGALTITQIVTAPPAAA